MAGPWEKYRTQPQAPQSAAPQASSGPWAKYATQPAPAVPEPQSDPFGTDLMGLLRTSPAGQNPGMGSQQGSVDLNDVVQGDPTMITSVIDNVVGLDNGIMTPGEKLGTALNSAGESATLGIVGDEAAAAFDAALGRGSYEERRDFYRQNQEQFREENPVLSFASEIAPALLPGLGGAKLLQMMQSKLGRAGAGAALGALSGAIYGFAEGEESFQQRAKQGGITALFGGAVGGAAPKVVDGLTGIPKGVSRVFQRSQEKPTIQTLKSAKNAAYRAVDQSGETFSGDDMQRLYQNVSDVFDSGNYVEEVDNASRAVLRVLERRQGKPTTLSQLDDIRQNMWRRYGSAKDQPQILDAIRSLDDLIDERAGASDLMGLARAANSRYAKFQLLDDAFSKAADQTASTGSGGNILNKYRQAVTSIINNPNKARWFSADEVDMMRKFVHGSASENALRRVGKLSPNGNGLMMALHIFGGIQTGGATIPIMAAGAAAKSAADRTAMRGADALKSAMAGQVPQNIPLSLPAGAAVSGAIPVAESAAGSLLEMLPQGQQSRLRY
ncbi:hypothetical protein PhaeoP48_01216 [Phaeobacter inhibens]|uniref:hypothetical protein n=1 Tax=Phaeobacter inhibens TaxID=221822 RepID=UPI000C9CA636|nr:hypothetical protein [Phaeobacter inhibens]AUR11213.1 hypothetical protein PhaeoP48_01216 [Phaeobacter inhibens]